MYLDTCKVRSGNKVYTRVLLRESYRQDGKVKHRTIANLSKCSDQEIAAIKLALQHKHDLAAFRENAQLNPNFTLRQGLSIGAVAVLEALARELGLVKALGTDREGKLALWQVIDQGSRLSAVRLAQTHGCCDLLKLDAFNEDGIIWPNSFGDIWHTCVADASVLLGKAPSTKYCPFRAVTPICLSFIFLKSSLICFDIFAALNR
jgi:hypothetical protein